MNDNDELEIDDEALEAAAGGFHVNLISSLPSPNYTVNQTIYFQTTITDTVS